MSQQHLNSSSLEALIGRHAFIGQYCREYSLRGFGRKSLDDPQYSVSQNTQTGGATISTMVYLAHTENERGVAHPLKDHLRSVGELASEFAAQMNPAMCEAARWAGLLLNREDLACQQGS